MKKFCLSLQVLFLVMVLFSCNEKETNTLSDLQGKEMLLEDFFEKVSSTDIVSEEKVLLISYKWNEAKNTIIYETDKWEEPSWGLALEVAAISDNAITKRKPDSKVVYKVACTDKDGNVTNSSCDGKYSCGKTIYDCLKSGGCAEICPAKMVYVPEIKTFFLAEDYRDLILIEE